MKCNHRFLALVEKKWQPGDNVMKAKLSIIEENQQKKLVVTKWQTSQ